MATNELTVVHIPVAQQYGIYDLRMVEKKLAKLPAKEHENQRALYERMIERGEYRFVVKPSSPNCLDELAQRCPNFAPVIRQLQRDITLANDSPGPMDITPMLFLGEPGIGKTHFANQVARLIGTGYGLVSMSSLTAGWILGGASSQWKGAKLGKVGETLIDGNYANPVLVVDEIDKARGEHAYDPLGALYTLLEHDTASVFVDEFADVPIDASKAIWVATANEERAIPEAILNRFNVFEIKCPTPDHMRVIVMNLYKEIIAEHGWHFAPELSEQILEKLAAGSPRSLRRLLTAALGEAKVSRRDHLIPSDMECTDGDRPKKTMGFTN